jgi:TonB family protein
MPGVDTLAFRVRDTLGVLPDAAGGDPDRDVAQLLTTDPAAFKAYVEGKVAAAAHDYPAAIEAFKRATEKDPTFAAAHALLSKTYASMGKGELERQARMEAEAKARARAEEGVLAAERLKKEEAARLEEMRKRAEGRQAEEAQLRQKAEEESRQMAAQERKGEPAAGGAETPPGGTAHVKEGDLVDAGDLTAAPRVLQKTELRISADQLRRNRHGVIILSVLIGPQGHVEDVKVLRSDAADYSEPARDSVRKWTFSPPEKDGVKVRTWFSVTVRF